MATDRYRLGMILVPGEVDRLLRTAVDGRALLRAVSLFDKGMVAVGDSDSGVVLSQAGLSCVIPQEEALPDLTRIVAEPAEKWMANGQYLAQGFTLGSPHITVGTEGNRVVATDGSSFVSLTMQVKGEPAELPAWVETLKEVLA